MKKTVLFLLSILIIYTAIWGQIPKEVWRPYKMEYRINKYYRDSLTSAYRKWRIPKRYDSLISSAHSYSIESFELVNRLNQYLERKTGSNEISNNIYFLSTQFPFMRPAYIDTVIISNDSINIQPTQNQNISRQAIAFSDIFYGTKPYTIFPFVEAKGQDSMNYFYWVDLGNSPAYPRPRVGRLVGTYYLHDNLLYKVLKYEIYAVNKNAMKLVIRLHFCPKLGQIGMDIYNGIEKPLIQYKLFSINDIPLRDFIEKDTCITPFCHFGE